MGQSKEYRFNTVIPAAPVGTGVFKIYADGSGVLKSMDANSVVYTVGQVLTSQLSGNTAGTLGGLFAYFAVQGPSGQRLAIPAYTLT